jgi:hypothetical protein
VLEFLYTGNYTVGRLIPRAQDPQLNSDTECAKGSLITSISGVHAPNQPATEVEEVTNEITIHSSENIAQDRMGGSDQSDQEDAVEPVIDHSAECHPCYFHMRVFGEADYL